MTVAATDTTAVTAGTEGAAAATTADQATAAVQAGAGPDRSWIPEPFRTEKAFEVYKEPAALFKSHLELQKAMGSRVAIPGPDAKPEQVQAFRKARGVPDTEAGYTLTMPDLPESLAWEADQVAAFRKVAHEIGLTPSEAQRLVDHEAQQARVRHEGIVKAAGEATVALKAKWGAEYPAKKAAVEHLLANVPPTLATLINELGAGADQATLEWFADLADRLREDTAAVAQAATGGMSLEEAQGHLKNPLSPYFLETHADHVRVKRDVQAAMARAFPEKKPA